MTDEQLQKATLALMDIQLDNLRKANALEWRRECINNVSFFGLPYRVLYDLRYKKLQPDKEIQLIIPFEGKLNRFYPRQRESLQCRNRITQRVLKAFPECDIRDYKFAMLHIKPQNENMAKIQETAKEVEREENEKEYTPAAKREFYFTSFLEYCDIDSLKNYELTGEPITLEEETKLKMKYKQRLKHYREHPELYSPRLLKSDDKTEYWKPDED